MKIAVLGDIHGNLPAMEAVLRDAKQRRAASVWCLGDLVGYGPFPDEVVAAVREGFILSLRGNYDSKVLRIPTRDPAWFREKGEEKARVFSWAWEHLSPGSREYLASLPESLRLTVEGYGVLLVHGSPASPREHLSPDTPE
ncbi:MAG TPA: metallophosphoesterase family protein, partial [Synergistaceae bacterium]|nr:metallophosphoesterase family protein [Synergistaceae bacterium]